MAELDPTKTYLEWTGSTFPNSSDAEFKAPAGSSIDWGDGNVETFDVASTEVNTHTYTDGLGSHTIIIRHEPQPQGGERPGLAVSQLNFFQEALTLGLKETKACSHCLAAGFLNLLRAGGGVGGKGSG